MLMNRPIAWLAAVVVAVAVATDVKAQGLPTSPGQEPIFKFQPFLDPGYFNPDFQFFAPAEVDDFGGEEKGNTGLYVTFDRTYVAVSRPRNEFSFGSGNQMDFTWGNRMEAGYMKDDGHGWQAGLWHVNGPNENFSSADYIQRMSDAQQTVTLNILTPGAINSVNNLKMSSFELNKTWRLKQYHNGTTMEPIVGYRYMNVRDYYTRNVSFNEFPGTLGIPVYAIGDEFLQTVQHSSQFENNMHGGQIGARIFRQRGHWLLSADVRFFTMANFQTLKVVNSQSYLPNPDLELVDGVNEPKISPFGIGGDVNRQLQYYRATQFVFGGEVRAEASYELTRDINLRFGFTFLDMGQGIGRGDLMRLNNQSVVMTGATFGFTVNR